MSKLFSENRSSRRETFKGFMIYFVLAILVENVLPDLSFVKSRIIIVIIFCLISFLSKTKEVPNR